MNCDVTFEALVAFADSDLDESRCAELARHVEACPGCRERLAVLAGADALVRSVGYEEPSAAASLAARRAISEVTRPRPGGEIMTLEEVADFLRITPEQLGEIAEDLPAFELAGQVRVRRERLMEWIEQREQRYTRQVNESWAARARAFGAGKGVA